MGQHLFTALIVIFAGLPAFGILRAVDGLVVGAFNGNLQTVWLVGGIAVGFMGVLVLRREPRVRFLLTLQHELAHTVALLVMGGVPRSLAAKGGAGAVSYEIGGHLRRTRGFLIAVAPYWHTPLLAVPLVLLLLEPQGLVRGAVACLLGLCLATPVTQISIRQPDLRRYHLLPPVAAVAWLWSASVVISLCFARSGSITTVAHAYGTGWATFWGILT